MIVRKPSLPIAPVAPRGRRNLKLLDERASDAAYKPIYVVWEITLQCDLACRHCGSRAGKARPDELSTAEALDLIRQLGEMGTLEVSLIGGEAYLREDWLELVRAIVANGMRCLMTTGGRNFTVEKAGAGKEAGLTNISVSVDGLEEVHDALRGVPGSYQAALRAIKACREVGLTVGANTQISRPALRQIPAVFDVLSEAGIRGWQTILTTAMGRAGDRPELLLEPYQMMEAMTVLHRIKPLADARKVELWIGNNLGYFGPYESELRDYLPRGHRGSCGAGRSTLGIEADGSIKGCPSLPSADYTGGNIRDESLRAIWERSAELRFTRDRTVEDLHGFCRTCYYAEECLAGCTWTSHVLFGKAGNNPFCHHRNLEFLREGKRERLKKVKDAPNLPFDYGHFEIVVEDWPEDELLRARKLAETGEGWIHDPPTNLVLAND